MRWNSGAGEPRERWRKSTQLAIASKYDHPLSSPLCKHLNGRSQRPGSYFTAQAVPAAEETDEVTEMDIEVAILLGLPGRSG
jgi:hypothetical protein